MSYVLNDQLHIFNTIRRSFLLVTPDESSFATLEEAPDYYNEGTSYFALLLITETVLLIAKGGNYRANDAITSGSSFIIYQATSHIFIRPLELMAYIWFYNHFNIVDLPWNSSWTWFLMLFGYDFCFYWSHRAGHEVNFFWAIHQSHHSSEGMNISTTARFPMFHDVITFTFFLPLALFVRPSIYFIHFNLSQLYQIYTHIELIPKLGPLDWIFNTASNHRVHHARNRYCIDRNYGGVFIIWDHLFGTYQPEKDGEKLHYGLVHPIKTFDPWEVQFCHFKHMARSFWQMEGLKNKLSVIFKGPGWAPGKPRLGLPEDIPELPIKREIVYNPKVSGYAQVYAVIHYLITLILISLLVEHRDVWPKSLLLIGVLINLATVTTIAKIFDAKQNAWNLELIRCVLTAISLLFWRALRPEFDIGVDGGSSQSSFILLVIAVLHIFSAVGLTFYIFVLSATPKESRTNFSKQSSFLTKNTGSEASE